MDILALLEQDDEITLLMTDMQEKKATFRGYDFDSGAMIVEVNNEMEAIEFDDIKSVELPEAIKSFSMINTKLALSKETIARWRDSNRTKKVEACVINSPIGNGVLEASTRRPDVVAK